MMNLRYSIRDFVWYREVKLGTQKYLMRNQRYLIRDFKVLNLEPKVPNLKL